MEKIQLTVSDFIAITNQTLEYAYPSVVIEGEVSSFKVNQGKYVFFDLKDSQSSVGCFMTVWQLRQPIQDGMQVIVVAQPKLTNWGKFSLTVQSIRLKGEGDIKKSNDILKAKLEQEGLFSDDRKRLLPKLPENIAVISSTQAAGYGDFIRILDDRWSGLKVSLAHVQVQGESAADQIINAMRYFNGQEKLPEVIVIVRGGGSLEDLSTFNDERLVREIASSRVPVLTGIGHEIDVSLADLAADRRAATPSNAAQILVPDKMSVKRELFGGVGSIYPSIRNALRQEEEAVARTVAILRGTVDRKVNDLSMELRSVERVLSQLNPSAVLERGYAIVRGKHKIGELVEIETRNEIIKAKVVEREDTSKNR